MKIHHIFADAEGRARIVPIELDLGADQSGLRTPFIPAKLGYLKEFAGGRKSGAHNAPRRQFVIHLYGGGLVYTQSGDRIDLQPGDVVFAENLEGEGHFTDGTDGPRGAFYVPVADDFDFPAWCAGREPTA